MTSAREAGIDFLDHADVYGGELHQCEARFAEAMQLSSSEREQVTLQTKAGIVPSGPYFDYSYEHLIESVEGSLTALETDYIDILLLHRPDALVEPEEVARAFDELHASGKVRNFGVSNHTPRQIDLLAKHLNQPIVANQLAVVDHALHVHRAGRLGEHAGHRPGDRPRRRRDPGLLPPHDITSCRPGRRSRPGSSTACSWAIRSTRELNAVIDRLAAKYDVAPEAIATAWITRHPAQMQVVLGTTTPLRSVGFRRRLRDPADPARVVLGGSAPAGGSSPEPRHADRPVAA